MKHFGIISIMIAGVLAYASTLLFEKKGESYIQQSRENGGQLSTTIRNQDYRILEFYSDRIQPDMQLLDIVKDVKKVEGVEGLTANLKLSLFSSKQEKFDTLVWQLKEEASDWALLEDPKVLVTLLSGCCGVREGARIFNISNGKMVMSYTPMIEVVGSDISPFILEIPHTQIVRFVGVLSADSSRDFPRKYMERDSEGYQAVAILKYADQNSTLQQILIKIKVAEGFIANLGTARWLLPSNTKNEMNAGRVTLWENDGQPDASHIGGVSFEIKVFGGSNEQIIQIPLVNDKLDVNKAVKPNDVKLIAL